MLGEIDSNFYCSDVMCKKGVHRDCLGTKPETPEDDYLLPCPNCHRKWPTPDQFKAEYGEEYPDNGAVYVRNSGWGFMVENYLQAKKRLIHVPETEIACACTPWGKPPDDWRPE